jgi:hypothetical protein
MHSTASWPRPAARGTRPVSDRGQSPPAPRPAQGKCPAGRSRPRRQTAGAGSLISPDGIVSEERLLSHKRTRTTAAMLVTGATAIVPCSHSADNRQLPSTSHAQCRAVSMDGQRRGCSGNQLNCPKTSVDDHGHRPTKAQTKASTPADGRRRHSCFAPYAGARGPAWLTAARTGRCDTGLPPRSRRSRSAASTRSPSPLARPRAAPRRARAAGPPAISAHRA